MSRWEKTDARCVEWRIHSEFDGPLMPRLGVDVPELTNIWRECRKSFRCGDHCQMGNRGFGAVCEDGGGCRGLASGQKFWVEDYPECGFCIGLDALWTCDFGITASCMDALDVEWRPADVSRCYGSRYRSFPFRERSEVYLLVCQDEFS